MNWSKVKNLLNKDAVIDNNIICDFTELGCVEILNEIFSKVLIPESIINDEVNIEGCVEALNRLKFQGAFIERLETYEFMKRILVHHGGLTDYDAEVISIAYEKYVLCTSNEKRMMTVCEENNIEYAGTVGILCCAYENMLIDSEEFNRLIKKLFNECSCFLSRKLKQEIISHYGLDIII